MVNSSDEPQQNKSGPGPSNPTIVPLAIPIVAGPGLLSTMLIQSTQQAGFTDDMILLACAVSIGLYVH